MSVQWTGTRSHKPLDSSKPAPPPREPSSPRFRVGSPASNITPRRARWDRWFCLPIGVGTLQLNNSAPDRNRHRLGAIIGPQFSHDVLEMYLDRLFRDE